VVEESGIASSAQIGLVLNRVHFAALQVLHHDCTVQMPAEPTAGASSERKCARELASIHYKLEASSLGSRHGWPMPSPTDASSPSSRT